jgi:hypothetical protein
VSSELEVAVAAAIAGGTISVIGAIASQVVAGRERRETNKRDIGERANSRREEFLFRALEHFGGGTQERSVGIAIAEAFWRSVPQQVDVLVPLLLNQLVYLLGVVDTAKSAGAAHERQNVRRIVDLLEEISDIQRFREAYSSSLRAIREPNTGFGLDLTPDPEIDARVRAFRSNVEQTLG